MTPSAPRVVVADEFAANLTDALKRSLPAESTVIQGLDSEEAGEAQFAVTWSTDIGQESITRLPNLQALVKLDSGPAKIDRASLEQRNVAIGIAASPALVSVAEHAVMLILAVFKRLGPALKDTEKRNWAEGISSILTNQEEYSYNWVGIEKWEAVTDKTIGLVGLGRIGIEVAKRLTPFGCDVVYTKRNQLSTAEEQELGVRYLPFGELLAESHCVSLHNRFTPETEKMMDADAFASMPKGSFFVNTARGRLVDEDALVDALESGHLAGAALDVAWYEPPLDESRLWNTKNLMITPHSAGIPIDISLVEELAAAGEIIAGHWNSGGH